MGMKPATEAELISAIRELVRLGPLPLDATVTVEERRIIAHATDLLLPVQHGVPAYDHLEAVADSVRSSDAEKADEIMQSALAFANLHR